MKRKDTLDHDSLFCCYFVNEYKVVGIYREGERGFLNLADMGGLRIDELEELAIGNILLGEHSLETLMVGRVELRLTLLLVSRERSLGLARGDDNNRQGDLALLAANVLKEIKAAAEGLVGS